MNEALIQDDNIHPDYAIQLIFLDTAWLIIQCIFEQNGGIRTAIYQYMCTLPVYFFLMYSMIYPCLMTRFDKIYDISLHI